MMKRPIRILHVVTIMNIGGIETFLMTLYRNIDRESVQFDFLVHRKEDGFFDEEIKRLGGRIFHIRPLNPFFMIDYEQQLGKILRENKFEIVHSHLNANSSIILSVAKKNQIKYRIAHSHIDKTVGKGSKAIMKKLSKLYINKVANYKFACSRQAGNWLFGYQTDFRIFSNAVDSEKFLYDAEKREKYRKKLKISNDSLVIGNIARFNTQKNHNFILDVFADFAEKNPNSRLVLLGEGDLLSAMQLKSEKLGIRDKVIFTGSVDNANDYLNVMDVFLFPSFFEGLGIVAVEAQINGLPVIMNETLPEELDMTDLVHRLPIDVPVELWTDKMDEILSRKSVRSSRQEEIISKGYDIRKNVKYLENFYLSLM